MYDDQISDYFVPASDGTITGISIPSGSIPRRTGQLLVSSLLVSCCLGPLSEATFHFIPCTASIAALSAELRATYTGLLLCHNSGVVPPFTLFPVLQVLRPCLQSYVLHTQVCCCVTIVELCHLPHHCMRRLAGS